MQEFYLIRNIRKYRKRANTHTRNKQRRRQRRRRRKWRKQQQNAQIKLSTQQIFDDPSSKQAHFNNLTTWIGCDPIQFNSTIHTLHGLKYV